MVLPDGTYRMVGVVTENVQPTTPIVGARVEVTGGTPLAAITDWDGRYRLYGVPGTADIRVTRDGYQPHVQRLQLTEHVTQNFQLALSGMRLDLAGPYTLAIDVTCVPPRHPCAADLRHRSYAAFLTQSGSTLEVVLTESSRFRVNSAGRGDRFSGRVDAAGATFNLEDFFFQYYFYGPMFLPLSEPRGAPLGRDVPRRAWNGPDQRVACWPVRRSVGVRLTLRLEVPERPAAFIGRSGEPVTRQRIGSR